jgi:hypothetical protein
MALDTKQKRMSAASAGCPALPPSVFASGALDNVERLSLAWSYCGNTIGRTGFAGLLFDSRNSTVARGILSWKQRRTLSWTGEVALGTVATTSEAGLLGAVGQAACGSISDVAVNVEATAVASVLLRAIVDALTSPEAPHNYDDAMSLGFSTAVGGAVVASLAVNASMAAALGLGTANISIVPLGVALGGTLDVATQAQSSSVGGVSLNALTAEQSQAVAALLGVANLQIQTGVASLGSLSVSAAISLGACIAYVAVGNRGEGLVEQINVKGVFAQTVSLGGVFVLVIPLKGKFVDATDIRGGI